MECWKWAWCVLVIWIPPTLFWSSDCPGRMVSDSPSNNRFLGKPGATGEWKRSTADTDDTGEADPFSPALESRFTIGFVACCWPASPSRVNWLGRETSSQEGTGRPDVEMFSHNGLSERHAMDSKIFSSIYEVQIKTAIIRCTMQVTYN